MDLLLQVVSLQTIQCIYIITQVLYGYVYCVLIIFSVVPLYSMELFLTDLLDMRFLLVHDVSRSHEQLKSFFSDMNDILVKVYIHLKLCNVVYFVMI